MATGVRVIPHDIEAEEALLGAMLLSREATAKVIELVRAGDLYQPANAHIFTAIETLYRRGDPVDAITVTDELRHNGQLDQLPDGPSTFISLQRNTPSIPNAMHYGQIVVKHSTARRLSQIAAEMSNRVFDFEDPYELREEAQAQLAMIDVPVTTDRQEAETLDDIVDTADELSPWVIPGVIRTDWRIVLVAGEGSGKSTLLRQVAACSAQGIHPFRFSDIPPVRVLVVDLENPRDAIAETGATLVDLCRRRRGDAYVPSRLRVFRRPGGLDIRTRHDRSELEREIMLQQPSLVCIGPGKKLIRRREQKGGRESYEDATDPVFEILDDLRSRYGFGLLIEHHAPKGDPRNRAMTPYGSALWLSMPEMGITMVQEGDPWRYTLGRFRGDRLQSDWPDEVHRSDRMGPRTREPWPWEGRWTQGKPMKAAPAPVADYGQPPPSSGDYVEQAAATARRLLPDSEPSPFDEEPF